MRRIKLIYGLKLFAHNFMFIVFKKLHSFISNPSKKSNHIMSPRNFIALFYRFSL